MSLPESLERAAEELDGLAEQIRSANGDPYRLLEQLSAEDAGRVLVCVLNDEADAAAELIDIWGETDDGVAVLLNASDDGVAKAGRKLLRRARHRLRSQGIEVKAPEAKSAPKKGPGSSVANADKIEAAHLSTPDFRGARMGYLVDSHPSGGARLFEIRFDESRGILDFKIYNAGRSKVRGFLRSLTKGNAQRLFEVERDALCALVRRASLAQPVDRPLPSSFVEWRGRLFPESLDSAQTPGAIVRSSLGPADDAILAVDAVAAEIRESQVGPWPPSTAWVSDWMDKGTEAVEGLEGEARGEKIESWTDEVAEGLRGESLEALMPRQLEELAWARWKSGDEGMAQSLIAASDAIQSDAAAATLIARARVESLFGPFLAQLRVVEVDALSAGDE
ncbi:MAG: hypothetical protein AB8G23_08685 [Myxococcota bacterium]